MTLQRYGGHEPRLAANAWVAPHATVLGDVRLGAASSVWYGAVLRADGDTIDVGPGSNIQDCCVAHTDEGFPIVLGRGVLVGHGACLHGCTVEDDVLVGMGAVVMNGARIGAGSIVAVGAVVLEGTDVPPRSLVAGVPGKVRRDVAEAEVEKTRRDAAHYETLARRHAQMQSGSDASGQ